MHRPGPWRRAGLRRCVRTEPGTELVLVRHGRGRCNDAGVIGGRAGCRGLTADGRSQSRRLAARLAAMATTRPFDVLVTSPRLRVRQSAGIVADALGLPVTVVDGLAGQEFGTADGRRWARVTAGFGGEPAHDPDRPIAPGAEPWNAYADRVLAALTGILTAHAGRRVCLVGHGKTAGLAAALLSGAPDPRTAAPALVIAHGELSVWRRDATGWHHQGAGRAPATVRRS